MAVIGVGELLIVPTFRGLQKEVAKEVDGAVGAPGVEKAGSTLGNKLSKGMGRVLKAGAVTVGAALATTMWKGLGRLQALEQARAKLVGLGHDAKAVDGIMKDVNGAVKGTAFGMDEAASAAAGALASGIKPGKELTAYLTLVGDAATQAGVEFNDMAGMMGKVQGQGRLTGDVVAQMADNGLYVLPMLAEEYGVTQGEMTKMVSAGKVDAERFKKVLDENIGGAAQASGDTVQGAMKNAGAAIGRFGANLLADVYPMIKEFFTGFKDWMEPLEARAMEWGEKIGDAFKSVVSWIGDNKDAILGLLPVLATLAGGMAAYFAITKTMAAFTAIHAWYTAFTNGQKLLNAVMKANPIGLVITAITLLVAGLVWLYKNNETARRIMDAAWTGIKNAVMGAWEGFIKPAFNAITNFVKNVLGPAFVWFRDKVIKPVWDGIAGNISTVWNKMIKPVFDVLMNVVKGDMPAAFEAGKKAIKSIWEGIKSIARSPVVAIVDVVYNNGLKALFNGISDKLGLKWKLPDVTVPQFAKGGQMKHGWKLVGEEGPELINTGPGYVYTAGETKKMLAGQSQMPMGAIEQGQQAHEGIGGWSDIWGGVKNTFGGVKDWVVGQIGKAVTAMVKPIKGMIGGMLPGSGINDLMRGGVNKLIDDMTGWAVKKDDAAAPAGGFAGSMYNGALGRFFRPVGGRITSGFGASRGRWPHAGIDFAVPTGTAVKAAFDGVVQRAAWNAVGGRTGMGMLLGHGKGKSTYYGHLSGWNAKPGQQVKAGETIARSGNTGNSTGPHLHFETWNGGKPHNPMAYLHDQGGKLMPGLSMILNKTGKPEAILNQRQWDTQAQNARLVAAMAGSGGGVNVSIVAPEQATAGEYFRIAKHEVAVMNRRGGRR